MAIQPASLDYVVAEMVADVVDEASLQKVREFKKQQKAAARAGT